ncbi:MAG TPA: hypothetical protein VNI36_04095 [Candidatus Dormibacteraeota bacterium]|nr:hypothetical protein [Candidatus Dormibacteraeota bacterium]
MSSHETTPGVFIIESTKLIDEEEDRQEGKALQAVLKLAKRPVLYRYIRTEKELKKMLIQFHGTRFRYLHLACHGNDKEIGLTFDDIRLTRLAQIVRPFMHHRRLFISACESAHSSLAVPLLSASKCYSVVGPANEIPFRDAVIAWASFYTLMSKQNPTAMKRAEIQETMQRVCDLFRVSFNAFSRDGNWQITEKIRPRKRSET